MMPKLYDKRSGTFIGTISEADLGVLIDRLEEEHRADDDYFIDAATIDLLEEGGASASLVALLRAAVGDSEGVDVRYER